MTYQKQSQVFFMMLVLTSVLLGAEATTLTPSESETASSTFSASHSHSDSSSYTNSHTDTYSQTVTNTGTYSSSYSNTYSMSHSGSYTHTYTMTYSNTYSQSYSQSNTYSTSYTASYTGSYSGTLSEFFTGSITRTNSFSNTYTPSIAPVPIPPERCTCECKDECPSNNDICMFYKTEKHCTEQTLNFRVCADDGETIKCWNRLTTRSNERPQFVLNFDTTDHFVVGPKNFHVTVTPLFSSGIVGLPCAGVNKFIAEDEKIIRRSCDGNFACQVGCKLLRGNGVDCGWHLGQQRIKRAVVQVRSCVNSISFVPILIPFGKPPYFFRSKRFQQISQVTLTVPPSAMCSVTVTLRYPKNVGTRFGRRSYSRTTFFIWSDSA